MVATAVKSVSLLPLGILTLDQSILTYRRFPGQKVDCPVIAVFIEMADGEHILFDTGLPPALLEDPEFLPAHQAGIIASYTAEDDIRNRLKAVGAMPEDVKGNIEGAQAEYASRLAAWEVGDRNGWLALLCLAVLVMSALLLRAW